MGAKRVMLYNIFSIILLLLFIWRPFPCFAEWQSDLEKHFDIVDTFDNLADWVGSGSYYGDVTASSAMPQVSGGGASIWNYYSDWHSGSNGSKWIGDFGTGTKVGSSGKSLRMGVNRGEYGPGRLGAYFGSGSASSGYKSIYLFYRVYFPSGYFPSGLTYEKLGNIGHGFTAAFTWRGLTGTACNGDGESCRQPYGQSSFVPQAEWSGPQFRLRAADYSGGTYPYDDEVTSGKITESEWIGIEYHLTIDDDNADSDEVEIWMYDSSGNASLVFIDSSVRLHHFSSSAGDRWNWFFIGGNSHDGGSSTYYVDDVIIDDGRIGPIYFSLLNGNASGTTPKTVQNLHLID